MSQTDPRPDSRLISEEEIRLRAYFLSLECGNAAADAVHHWLTAERQLREETAQVAAPSARSGTRKSPRSARAAADHTPATSAALTTRQVRSRASAKTGTGAAPRARHTRN